MRTPAHLIFGATAFGGTGDKRVTRAAVWGSLVPDLSLYIMVAVSIWVLGIPAHRVFDELYFSDAWQNVFAIDNSFVLWGCLLAAAIYWRWPAVRAFASGGLLHLACDFPLHNEDARRQFWPISDYVFRSPLSYYDPHRHGNIVGPIEMTICVVFSIVLWRRYKNRKARGWILLALGLEVLPSIGFWIGHHLG